MISILFYYSSCANEDPYLKPKVIESLNTCSPNDNDFFYFLYQNIKIEISHMFFWLFFLVLFMITIFDSMLFYLENYKSNFLKIAFLQKDINSPGFVPWDTSNDQNFKALSSGDINIQNLLTDIDIFFKNIIQSPKTEDIQLIDKKLIAYDGHNPLINLCFNFILTENNLEYEYNKNKIISILQKSQIKINQDNDENLIILQIVSSLYNYEQNVGLPIEIIKEYNKTIDSLEQNEQYKKKINQENQLSKKQIELQSNNELKEISINNNENLINNNEDENYLINNNEQNNILDNQIDAIYENIIKIEFKIPSKIKIKTFVENFCDFYKKIFIILIESIIAIIFTIFSTIKNLPHISRIISQKIKNEINLFNQNTNEYIKNILKKILNFIIIYFLITLILILILRSYYQNLPININNFLTEPFKLFSKLKIIFEKILLNFQNISSLQYKYDLLKVILFIITTYKFTVFINNINNKKYKNQFDLKDRVIDLSSLNFLLFLLMVL